MTEEQVKTVKLVYSRFIDSESDEWTAIDENIEYCSYLSDSELIKEVTIKYEIHCKSEFRCNQNHQQIHCFAPYILESVEAILNLYIDTEELHEKNRYILTYYIVMSDLGMIFSI
jgi:hypothetical protein